MGDMRLKLKEFCRKKRLTLSKLAHLSGIARMSLWRYATGKQDITLSQLGKIIHTTGCRLKDIVDDRDECND